MDRDPQTRLARLRKRRNKQRGIAPRRIPTEVNPDHQVPVSQRQLDHPLGHLGRMPSVDGQQQLREHPSLGSEGVELRSYGGEIGQQRRDRARSRSELEIDASLGFKVGQNGERGKSDGLGVRGEAVDERSEEREEPAACSLQGDFRSGVGMGPHEWMSKAARSDGSAKVERSSLPASSDLRLTSSAIALGPCR